MRTLLLDLDGCLGDTRPLWDAWVEEAAHLLGIEVAELPVERSAAAAVLDAKGSRAWRTLLERYAADRAPVYLRPDAGSSAALRRLEAEGATLGVFTDAPEELARVALSQLGAARRIATLEAGAEALARLEQRLGSGAHVVRTRAELVRAAG